MVRWIFALLALAAVALPAAAGQVVVRPIEPLTQQVVWVDEDTLALRVDLRWADTFGESVTGIAVRTLSTGEVRWLRLPQRLVDLAPAGDGRRVLGATDSGSLLMIDTAELRVERATEVDPGGVVILDLVGVGDDQRVLVARGSEAWLLDADGAEQGRFEIAGETPTITRVYHGGEGMHDNILDDSPSWIVAGAASADGRYVALGGSDSVVRLFDRTAGTAVELTHDWHYEEHRFLGGNPDLNGALDLTFTGDALGGVFVHGDVLRWDLSDLGAPPHRVTGACTDEELAASRSRFGEATPWDGASDFARKQDRKDCAHAHQYGALTQDGATAMTLVNTGLRVRDAHTGETRAQIISGDLDRPVPSWSMAVSEGGQLALIGLYGSVATWSPSGGLQHHVVRPSEWRGVEHLSPDGTAITLDAAIHRGARWDLTTGQREDVPNHHDPFSEISAGRPLLRERVVGDIRDEQFALSADGRVAAWIQEAGQQRARVTCLGPEDDPERGLATVEAAGWPGTIGLSPDGDEVLYTLQDGTAVRWRPWEQDQEVVRRSELMMARDVRYIPGSDVIALVGYRALVLVRDDDELTELATLYGLVDGEWALISVDGDVQISSEAALAELLTVVTDDAGGVTILDGRPGWQQRGDEDLWAALVGAPVAQP